MLPVPGFRQKGVDPSCKVIKLMSRLNCWRLVLWVIKSLDGAINRQVFWLFLSNRDKQYRAVFLFTFPPLSTERNIQLLLQQKILFTVFIKTLLVTLLLHLLYSDYTTCSNLSGTDYEWWMTKKLIHGTVIKEQCTPWLADFTKAEEDFSTLMNMFLHKSSYSPTPFASLPLIWLLWQWIHINKPTPPTTLAADAASMAAVDCICIYTKLGQDCWSWN